MKQHFGCSPKKYAFWLFIPDHARGRFDSAYQGESDCSSSSQILAEASVGIRQSPLGLNETEPTLTPSGRQLRLNCWLKKRR